ncbi:MAG: DUF4363 family protein [Clostridia bacterium]|nr:DUF4363 family protein [Clostridia bacterium]
MKRLYIALLLLVAVVAVCVLSHSYLHRQIDRMLSHLDSIETLARAGDTHRAVQQAEEFSAAYQRVCDRISCYVAHNELRESRETAALLPTLLRRQNEDELWMELARLRSQLLYIRYVDNPNLQNIL